jgi:hypothetical protein
VSKLPLPKLADVTLDRTDWYDMRASDGAPWITNTHVCLRIASPPTMPRWGRNRGTKVLRDMFDIAPATEAARVERLRGGLFAIGRWIFEGDYVALVERLYPGAAWYPNRLSYPAQPAHVRPEDVTVALVMRLNVNADELRRTG